MAQTKAKIKYEADTAQYEKAVKRMKSKTQELKEAGDKLRKGFGAIVTPFKLVGAAIASVVAAGGFLIKKYREQELAELRLSAALKTTNATRGVTLGYLKKMASDFQSVSLVGDEAGLEILQFGVRSGVAKENLGDFLQTMSDVAAATGEDARQLARSFQRGMGNAQEAVTALQTASISLDESQKEHIRTLFESGNAAEGQAYVLNELKKVYGGTAEAVTEGAGRWQQFFGFIGDGAEVLGGRLQRFLQPALDKVTEWIGEWVEEMDAADKKIEELNRKRENADFDFTHSEVARLNAEIATLEQEQIVDDSDRVAKRLHNKREELFAAEKRLEQLNKRETERLKNEDAANDAQEPIETPADTGTTGGAAISTAAEIPPSAHERGGYDTLNRNIQVGNQYDDDAQAAAAAEKAREDAAAAQAAAEEAERQRRVDAIRYDNETQRQILQMHQEGMQSELIAFYERRRELEEAERLLLAEERTAENEAELEALRIQKEALLAEEKEFNDKNKKSALAHFGDMLNIAKGFGVKSSALQKAQAVQGIATKIAELTAQTPAAASTAYQNTSEKFPFPIGPALGAIHAGLIVANAAAGISKAKGAISAQAGGIVPGSYTPGDSVPAFLQPGEMVVPIGKPFRNVEADIEARGAAKARAENNPAPAAPQKVEISFADDGSLSSLLRAEIVSNTREYG